MWMAAAHWQTHRLGLSVGGHPKLSLHSSHEPGELSQWPRHDDSIINIVTGISIIIIIIIIIIVNNHYCVKVPLHSNQQTISSMVVKLTNV